MLPSLTLPLTSHIRPACGIASMACCARPPFWSVGEAVLIEVALPGALLNPAARPYDLELKCSNLKLSR